MVRPRPGKSTSQSHCHAARRAAAAPSVPGSGPLAARWQYDAADLAAGAAIVEVFKPFLLDLLHEQALPKRTFNRHRDNLWLLGGELIRRRYDDAELKRCPSTSCSGT